MNNQINGNQFREDEIVIMAQWHKRNECAFFHELAHCAHERINGGLKRGQDPIQEIVAELSARALCLIVGKSGDKYLGNSYRYIAAYANKLKITPYSACLRVMSETEAVLNLILKGKDDNVQPVKKTAA